MRYPVYFLFLIVTWANAALGQERAFNLYAPPQLSEVGVMQFLAPRFALKNATRVNITNDADAADLVINDAGNGKPIFAGPDAAWSADLATDNAHAAKFLDWLRSDVGRRTIDSFTVAGTNPFSSQIKAEVRTATLEYDGDAALGHKVSLSKCGRCHVVDASNRMNAIGSTPSFAVLRSFDDWEERFSVFYILKPHPAFTQVEDVTEPFDETRPSPIVPVEMTLDEVEAILAFMAEMAPADLGQPLKHQ